MTDVQQAVPVIDVSPQRSDAADVGRYNTTFIPTTGDGAVPVQVLNRSQLRHRAVVMLIDAPKVATEYLLVSSDRENVQNGVGFAITALGQTLVIENQLPLYGIVVGAAGNAIRVSVLDENWDAYKIPKLLTEGIDE